MAGQYEIHRQNVFKLLYGRTFYPDMIPIYPDLLRRAEAVKAKAKVLAGKESGRLAGSIDLTSSRAGPYWWFRIEAHTPYAYYHHHGTKPHIIEGNLEFRNKGKTVHTRIVHHPGTRPNPYLKNALPAFMGLRESISMTSARL